MAWGLDDSTHQVIGAKFNPKTAKYGNEELENWISRGLSPRIDFSSQEITLPEGRVVVMMIDSAGNTPFKIKGTAFIRVGTYDENENRPGPHGTGAATILMELYYDSATAKLLKKQKPLL